MPALIVYSGWGSDEAPGRSGVGWLTGGISAVAVAAEAYLRRDRGWRHDRQMGSLGEKTGVFACQYAVQPVLEQVEKLLERTDLRQSMRALRLSIAAPSLYRWTLFINLNVLLKKSEFQ